MRTGQRLGALWPRHPARAAAAILGEVVLVDPRLGGDDGARTQAFGAQLTLARGGAQGAVAPVAIEVRGSGQGQVLSDTRHRTLRTAGKRRPPRGQHHPTGPSIVAISYFWKGSAGHGRQRRLSLLCETAFISYFPRCPVAAPRSPPAHPLCAMLQPTGCYRPCGHPQTPCMEVQYEGHIGIPRGLRRPFAFGMYTRLAGLAVQGW